MIAIGEPYSRDELTRALSALTLDGVKTLGDLPVEVFFAPQGDRWSPAEHVRHLRKSSAPLVTAYSLPGFVLRWRFGRPQRPSRSFALLVEHYRGALAAGGGAGRFAPTPEGHPAKPDDRRGEILTRWLETNSRLTSKLAHWRDGKLDAAQLPHPLLGMLTLREMVAFTVYHTVHHLGLVTSRLAPTK
jgi:hypothetical protein